MTQCASVCPVDCCVPDDAHQESDEELLAKKNGFTGNRPRFAYGSAALSGTLRPIAGAMVPPPLWGARGCVQFQRPNEYLGECF